MRKGFVAMLCLLVLAIFIVQVGTANAQTKQKTVVIENKSGQTAKVYINFGGDSQITKKDMVVDGKNICTINYGAEKNCAFELANNASVTVPNPKFVPLNFTVAFNAFVDCCATKSEINANKSGNDAANVSVVDGFNEKIKLTFKVTGKQDIVMGPPCGWDGNTNIYGVYPYRCDECVLVTAPLNCTGRCPGQPDTATWDRQEKAAPGTHCHKSTKTPPDRSFPNPACHLDLGTSDPVGTFTVSLLPKNAPCTPGLRGRR